MAKASSSQSARSNDTSTASTPRDADNQPETDASAKKDAQAKKSAATGAAKNPPTGGLARAKKSKPSGKQGSLVPSEQKLENLSAAISAAGSAENLLTILDLVEQAGGTAEVYDSIEAYRVLKAAVEQSAQKK